MGILTGLQTITVRESLEERKSPTLSVGIYTVDTMRTASEHLPKKPSIEAVPRV